MVRRCLVWYLVVALLALAVAPRVDASFSQSTPILASGDDRQKNIETVERYLQEKAVEKRLQELGFSLPEIRERLSLLDDRQVHALALRFGDLKTGGTAEGLVIGIVVILLVIGIVLPLLGIRIWR